MKLNFNIGVQTPANNSLPYNNTEAFQEAKSMMARKERISAFFDLDSEGYLVIRMESNTTNRFPLQINQSVLDWIMRYLEKGEKEDFGIDPTQVEKTDITDPNEFRKEMLMKFIESNIKVQFIPEFRDKRGRLSGTANFRNGSFFFYMDRTEEIVEYLREKNLIR